VGGCTSNDQAVEHGDAGKFGVKAVAALQGKPTTPKIGTKFTIITTANLNSAASQAAIYKTSC